MKKLLLTFGIISLLTGVALAIAGGTATVTTSGTAVALSSSKILFRDLRITAFPDNAGYIYVGGADVDESSGNADILDAGEPTYIPDGFLNEVYVDSSEDGDSVGFTYTFIANYGS